jgi:hypothetical protein
MRRIAAALALLLAAPGARAADHVIHISVDGLSAILLADLLEDDVNGDFDGFARLRDEGASTFAARTDYTHTITLPNHTSMLTGRPVLQPAGQPNTVHHGYTSNVDPTPTQTLHNSGNPNLSYVASAFDVVHDHGLSTALFASKSKFVLYHQSYDATRGAPDVTGADDGRDKVDFYVNAAPATMQASLLSGLAANHWSYVFVHYSNPDDVGHASGWGSAAWRNAVLAVDGYVAALLAAIDADPVLAGRTLVILSTDHGGTGFSHGGETDPANYTIPFFTWGDGVEPGADLYALNASTRLHPGNGRPDYNASPQPIRNGDGGNLALAELRLPPVPGSTIGAAQDLALAPTEIPALPPLAAVALSALLVVIGAGAARRRAR